MMDDSLHIFVHKLAHFYGCAIFMTQFPADGLIILLLWTLIFISHPHPSRADVICKKKNAAVLDIA